jgi:hypothetical protein
VIEFHEMPRVGTPDLETFEVVLYPNGDIKFQYPDICDASSATVGIENETGTRGSMWAHNPVRDPDDEISLGFIRNVGGDLNIGKNETTSVPSDIHASVSAAPNPFNPETNIEYILPIAGDIRISAFDVLGREVAVLFEGQRSAGIHNLTWNAIDLTSGVYFVQIEAYGKVEVLRTLLMK